MGRPKQNLLVARRKASGEEEPLLRHAARAAVESVARPVVVVLGDAAESLTHQIADPRSRLGSSA
jgi:hypothetical protein